MESNDVRYGRLMELYRRVEYLTREYNVVHGEAIGLSKLWHLCGSRFHEIGERMGEHLPKIRGVVVCGRPERGRRRYVWVRWRWKRLLPDERRYLKEYGSLVGYTGPMRALKVRKPKDIAGVDGMKG